LTESALTVKKIEGEPMRVGIIGCGYASKKHIVPLRMVPGVDIVAVCDISEDQAKKVARRYRINSVYQDCSRLIAEQRPDVLHILTPPHTHRDLSIQAMESGCHVLVEKPMALNAEEADAMIDIAQRRGVTLSICHNFLFEAFVVKAKALTSSGAIGKVISTDVFWRPLRGGGYGEVGTPRWIYDLPGGVFHEIASHPVYLQLAFQKDLKLVSAATKNNENRNPYHYNEMRALLEGDSGLASLSISISNGPREVVMKIYGTNMTLYLDFTTNTLLKLSMKGEGKASTALLNLDKSAQLFLNTFMSTIESLRGRPSGGHRRLIQEFYESLRRGKRPPVTAEEGRAVVAVLDQIWARLGF
jgi:predicted dehydrogenase